MWISAFTLILLLFLLPETHGPTILLKRAKRLRKLTGNQSFRSQSEIDMAAINPREVIFEILVRPFILAVEPAMLFANIFLGLACEC
jgi:MFS transporter, DHA1 family, multidrug resistance protein